MKSHFMIHLSHIFQSVSDCPDFFVLFSIQNFVPDISRCEFMLEVILSLSVLFCFGFHFYFPILKVNLISIDQMRFVFTILLFSYFIFIILINEISPFDISIFSQFTQLETTTTFGDNI